MTLVLAQVSFDRVTGLPQDRVVNTWHFSTPGLLQPIQADLDRIKTLLTEFYTLATANTVRVADYLSPFLTSPFRIRYYNMDIPQPRPPIREDTVGWAPIAGPSLPAEMAAVLSFRSAVPAGRLQRNYRGRVYIGPLKAGASVPGVGDMAMTSLLTVCMGQAGARLIAGGQTPGASWVTHSPTLRARGVEPSFAPVNGGFVDSAFDVQRRRGRVAEVRIPY
jgi:hypothetical protein